MFIVSLTKKKCWTPNSTGFSPAVAANAAKFNNPVHLNNSPTIAVVTSDVKTYGKTAWKATSKIHTGMTQYTEYPGFL